VTRSAWKLWILLALCACGGGSGGGANALPPANPPPSDVPLPSAPVVAAVRGVATVDLQVVTSDKTGLPAFAFRGKTGVAPTIDVKPGDKIVVSLKNELTGSGMAVDANLHFHGLTVSPRFPSDDVLTMIATPGQTLHYTVPIPKTQEPGLYWYHPHVHGETNLQVGLAGMSGAIVVEGRSSPVPALPEMKQHVIIVRDVQDASAPSLRRAGPADTDRNTHPCGPDPGIHLSVNNVTRPTVTIAPGESQLFRVVNATGHRQLVLQADGQMLQIVAIDGYALDTYPGSAPVLRVPKYVVPTAGRLEFVLTGPPSGASELRTLCYDAGPGGDPDPPEILADLRAPDKTAAAAPLAGARIAPAPSARFEGRPSARGVVPAVAAERIVRFTEDSNGFYINGQYYDPHAAPMFTVKTGTVERWTVLNLTEEVHDFHLHQVHFLVQAVNGTPVARPHWTDTFLVPQRIPGANGSFKPGTIQFLADFRDPVIRGTFLFHCHILDHEDGGMMAKIQAI